MDLEFIDISREEEDERLRANGTTGRRRAAGERRPRPVRQETTRREISQRGEISRRETARREDSRQRTARQGNLRTIGYENQRERRSEGQRPSAVQTQMTRQVKSVNPIISNVEHNRVKNNNRSRDNISTRNNRNISREGGRNYNYNHSRNENAVRRPRPADPRAQQERIRRRKIRKRKAIAARLTVMLALLLVIFLACFMLYKLVADFAGGEEAQKPFNSFTPTVQRKEVIKANDTDKPAITEDFLTVNEYSRPGEKLGKVKNIFVHYTANPGTSAAQNRSYFENLGITGETSASAHFVIGYEGEIIQCIPLEEIAYAVVQRNYDSISIECCYLSEDGKFTDATYQSLLKLSAWLLKEYKLAPNDMRRHYDEGGKKCPLYYVENEEAWEKFLSDLEQYIMNNQV